MNKIYHCEDFVESKRDILSNRDSCQHIIMDKAHNHNPPFKISYTILLSFCVIISLMDITAQLTIIMPTYNRGKYIAQALDSVLMQETSYRYIICIADDCSSDNSLEIAQSYRKQYPSIIHILESKSNQKLYKNILRVYCALQSKYFCVLDPDDYWSDSHKIQKALDFLESHQDYTMYCANTLLVNEDNTGGGGEIYVKKISESMGYDFSDFLRGKAVFGHTASSVYRNIFSPAFLEKMIHFKSQTKEVSFRGDSFRNCVHLHEGKGFFQNEVDSVYRITDSGIWTSSSSIKRDIMGCNFYKDMWLFYDKAYEVLLQRAYDMYCGLNHCGIEILLEHTSDSLYGIDEANEILSSLKSTLESTKLKRSKLKYKLYYLLYRKLRTKLQRKHLI